MWKTNKRRCRRSVGGAARLWDDSCGIYACIHGIQIFIAGGTIHQRYVVKEALADLKTNKRRRRRGVGGAAPRGGMIHAGDYLQTLLCPLFLFLPTINLPTLLCTQMCLQNHKIPRRNFLCTLQLARRGLRVHKGTGQVGCSGVQVGRAGRGCLRCI